VPILNGTSRSNLFGTYAVSQAFLPLVARSHGAMVNVLSLAALASVPFTPAYSVSKAAAFSLTQSLRALWAGRGVKVHAVFAGPVDTDMTRVTLTYQSFLPSPSREASSTAWKKATRTSSPIPCRSLSPRVGAPVQPRRWSASSPLTCRKARRRFA